jgi:diguanylate cyclase (GGDEF)-like protein/PAS domain S-box-containing protein
LPSKFNLHNPEIPNNGRAAVDGLPSRRSRVQIAFAHTNLALVQRCVQELTQVGFSIDSHIVSDPKYLKDHPQLQSFDLAVCEFPVDPALRDQVAELRSEIPKELPIILLVENITEEGAAALRLHGASDCVNADSIGHLPMAVRRTLTEKALRHERDRAELELARLRAHYRALAGNLSYGIFRCAPDGSFLDVNHALVTMLKYSSADELLPVRLAANIFADPAKRAQLVGQVGEEPGDPVEAHWTRKDGSSLRVRLSAQEVVGENELVYAYEVIVEDVTKQRELEDHLRRQAASDALTGLANYRHLIEVLDREIRRSNRTGREFALLMFDMDELKQLNDNFGHMAGSQALCRTADALTLFCRDIDTAARFGGDEFALLLPETGLEAACSVARRISNSIAEDTNGPRISVSVGIGVYPRDGENVESLVSAADSSMYSMKRQKRHPAPVGLAVERSQHP